MAVATRQIEYESRSRDGEDALARRRMFIGRDRVKVVRATQTPSASAEVDPPFAFAWRFARAGGLLRFTHLLCCSHLLIITSMGTNVSTPVLLRRIAQLEAAVGRLSEDLGTLRSAVSRQGQATTRAGSARRRPPLADLSAAGPSQPPGSGGLAGASARGEAARVQWVKDGLVVPGEQLAQAWGLTRQALAPAADRGEVFAVKIGNRLYYPQAFLALDRETVATVCRALGDLGASEKLMFWLREHGALGGKGVAAALDAGVAVAKVERLAAAWARERGAARVAAAA